MLSTTGDKVRIGIQARGTCPVFRNEICLEIQQENIAAGTSARAKVNEALKRLSTDRLTDDAFERGPAGHRKTAALGRGGLPYGGAGFKGATFEVASRTATSSGLPDDERE